ncbi:MAG TPA: SMC-Scp complex subunit ScpB [bacterium]|nr:SMC-Scp complex subunit ScpB [bacterium]
MLTIDELSKIIECIMFLSPGPVKIVDIARHLDVEESLVGEAVGRLMSQFEERGLEMRAVAGGYELVTRREYVEHLRTFFGGLDRTRISRAGLETLAIISYKQPVNRADIESLRGVNSSGAIKSLLDKGLIRISGRDETLGRPFLFSTTPEFLSFIGINSIEDLPPIESFDKKT